MRYDNPEPGKYQLIVRSVDERGEETVLASGPKSQGLYIPPGRPTEKQSSVRSAFRRGIRWPGWWQWTPEPAQQRLFFGCHDVSRLIPAWMPDGSGLLVLNSDQLYEFQTNRRLSLSLTRREIYSDYPRHEQLLELSVAANGDSARHGTKRDDGIL